MEFDELASRAPGESSVIRERVLAARKIQQERYKDHTGINCNAQMNSHLLHEYAWPDENGLKKLKQTLVPGE